MKHLLRSVLAGRPLLLLAAGRWLLLLTLLALLLAGRAARAQTPAWEAASNSATDSATGSAQARATAVDAGTGAVYVAGNFSGQVAFGSTLLVSKGGSDAFVARWNPATGVAVSGGAVYVAGYITNNNVGTSRVNTVQFGSRPLPGASASNNYDAFVARVSEPTTGVPTDWAWALAGGGTGTDIAYGVAVTGGRVALAGYIGTVATFGSASAPDATGAQSIFVASVNDGTTPLPVQLVQFTATASGPTAVRLAWATASEVHSARFEVQRSSDGAAFYTIGTVAAAGSSLTRRAYTLTDAAVPSGRFYYRLRQVDVDGTATYSPVRVVTLGGAAAGLALYPNPAPGGAATLLGTQPGTLVQMLDALGRPVATVTADAAGTARLAPPAGLASGVYIMRAGAASLRLTVE